MFTLLQFNIAVASKPPFFNNGNCFVLLNVFCYLSVTDTDTHTDAFFSLLEQLQVANKPD